MLACFNTMMKAGQFIRLARVGPREARGHGMHARRLLLLPILIVALASTGANAGLLSDEQLYFDPATIVRGYYNPTYLPNLFENNEVAWPAGTDPVVDADILPILKDAAYGPGYVYSQSDYWLLPNVHYFGDLTGGTFTGIFPEPGVYHVRTTRQSQAQQIQAVFAQSGHGRDDGKTDKSQKMPVPEGDVFFVCDQPGDEFLGPARKALEYHGRNVKPFKTKGELEKEIKKLGADQHVEIVAHGDSGGVLLGDQWLNSTNVGAFAALIKPHVKYLTFVACYVADGQSGSAFLQKIADTIGKCSAWDCMVYAGYDFEEGTEVVVDGWFTHDVDGEYVTKVPEPASLGLLVLGGIAVLRRRAA